MNKVKLQIEMLIEELSDYNQSISELANNQYLLLKKTGATLAELKDFLDDLKAAVAPFRNKDMR